MNIYNVKKGTRHLFQIVGLPNNQIRLLLSIRPFQVLDVLLIKANGALRVENFVLYFLKLGKITTTPPRLKI